MSNSVTSLSFGWFDARDVCVQKGYFVTRFEWTERFRAQVAPLRWINFYRGLWWVYESTSYFYPSSNFMTPRVATANDITRADLTAEDWMMNYAYKDQTSVVQHMAEEQAIIDSAKARVLEGKRTWGGLLAPPSTLNGQQL